MGSSQYDGKLQPIPKIINRAPFSSFYSLRNGENYYSLEEKEAEL
jgi:hypothetical protein